MSRRRCSAVPMLPRTFVDIAEELDANQVLPLERLRVLRAAAMAHRADDDAGRRWLSLEDQIARRIYMGA